jgi:VWA domain-containing protein
MLHTMKLFSLFLAACVSLPAQSADGCRERTAIVNVLDGHGVPVANLVRDNFKAYQQRKPLNILWSQHRDDPNVRIAVLLDVSGSMEGSGEGGVNKWKIAHAAATEFVSVTPSQAKVSFMTFAAGFGQKLQVLGNRQSIENWLNSPAVQEGKALKGTTPLYDTILTALADFGPAQRGDTIYVITDGGENASREHMSQLERSLDGSGVRLYAFLLNGPMSEQESSTIHDLYELTLRSGGFLFSVTRRHLVGSWFVSPYEFGDRVVASIQASTRMLNAQIHGYYVLGLQFPDASSKLEAWKLVVVDQNGRRRKDVTAAYPHQLASGACNLKSAQR